MKLTKKYLRALISEIVMQNPDGSFGGYAGLNQVGPDHPLNQQVTPKKIVMSSEELGLPPMQEPVQPNPPTQEEIMNAIKRAAGDIDREKDNAYSYFAEMNPDVDDKFGILQKKADAFMNMPTRYLIQNYLGSAMQKNLLASEYRQALENMLSNKEDVKTLRFFKIEDLDAVFGAEPVALNESLSRGSLYRRRYYGRY
mgnify:CR=1 FL=1|tara:strand:- start:2386 stop:2979 length:594 start_codon:yes stop_codon:yes gene_type:complete